MSSVANQRGQAGAGDSIFKGSALRVRSLGEGVVELCFDRADDATNKLDQCATGELLQVAELLAGDASLRGVLLTSAKESFVVGADIAKFGDLFALPAEALLARNLESNRALTQLEALHVPLVVAINGFALGGGLEVALAADFRVMSQAAQVGLPEVKLGLFPGLGGTVRLPRVAGVRVAIEWITTGASYKADAALAAGVVDEAAAPAGLHDAALAVLKGAIAADTQWRARRASRQAPVPISVSDAQAVFAAARHKVAKHAAKHQPAALAAVDLLERAIAKDRDAALRLEAAAFAQIAKSQAASSLVQIFLNTQALKKRFKAYAKDGRTPQRAAVLGAGIMGGGIAYTSAARGTSVVLKDIRQKQLDVGVAEARKLLGRQVEGGRLTQDKADAVLASITPQLDYAGFDAVDTVIEAVVEDLAIKHGVLREVETRVPANAVIASNTSSLRIDALAAPLSRPESFVGMHFFNPVPVMPLVEVIRGAKTSAAALATIVNYAVLLGKTPIVVKDGPGFLVNRILTPYMQGFAMLLADGADFVTVDRAMEAFGWPMGPAYLNDVVGMDTGVHVARIICEGFPERLSVTWRDPLALMVANGRYGQKNGAGFYNYEADAAGKPKKLPAPESAALLRTMREGESRDFSDEVIVERMMIPLIIEASLCLEEGVVGSAAELDMALLLGVGLPQYLGGALKYADWLGLGHVVARADHYAALGPQYAATPHMREMASRGQTYY